MTTNHIPYEALARAEAQDITFSLPTALAVLSLEQMSVVRELIADGYARGLEAGFTMCEFAGDDPGTLMEAYNAGIAEGRKE